MYGTSPYESQPSPSQQQPLPLPQQRASTSTATTTAHAGHESAAGLGLAGVTLRRTSSTGAGRSGSGSGGGMSGGGLAEIAKADQIVQHIYSKSLSIITQARLSPEDLASPSPSTSISESGVGLGLAPSGNGQGWRNVSAGGNVVGQSGGGVTGGSGGNGKEREKIRNDKWFNLDLPEHDSFKSDLRPYKSVSSHSPHPVPPLTLTISLDSSDLLPNQALVLSDSRGRRTRVDSSTGGGGSSGTGYGERSPKISSSASVGGNGGGVGGGNGNGTNSRPSVVLERWTINFDPSLASTSTLNQTTPFPPPPSSSSPTTTTTTTDTESLPSIYKTAIISLRSLFTLVRTLPTYTLGKRLMRRNVGKNDGIKLRARVDRFDNSTVSGGGVNSSGRNEIGVNTRIGVGIGSGDAWEGGGGGGGGGVERTTEEIRFPGIVTPLGTLSISVVYRINTEFSVETIEALLSSTFIDQDFFRPTVARYQREREREERRPGSLPTSGRLEFQATTGGLVPRSTHSPSAGSSPLGGITAGFNARPSYGSLSSRHHLSASPSGATPLPVPHASSSSSPDPTKVPLPITATGTPSNAQNIEMGSNHSSASASASASGVGVSRSVGVEPAFVSLSRARGSSYTGRIERASTGTPLSSSPTTQPMRRPSFTSGSASSGSPIFRPSSFISSPPLSSSPLTGPTSNINRVSTSNPITTLNFSARSPLAPPLSTTSNLSSAAPRPIPSPSNSPGMGIGIGIPRTYASSPAGGGGGSYSRSFGRGSSGGSISGGETSGTWGGPESLGRRTGRLSFDGRYGTGYQMGGGRSFSSSHATLEEGVASSSRSEDKKKFLPDAKDDSDDINSFLGMIDSRPDLSRPSFGGKGSGKDSAGGTTSGSMILSKVQVDETLKKLAGSVYTDAVRGDGTTSGSDSSPRLLSALRHQSSRLSIEEEPAEAGTAEEGAAEKARPKFTKRSDIAFPSRNTSNPHSASSTANPTPPYPPATHSGESSSTSSPAHSGLTFPQYIQRSQPRSSFATNVTTGFDLPPPSPQQTSASASIASFGEQQRSTGSYGGEEEAVGRLELSDEDLAGGPSDRGRSDGWQANQAAGEGGARQNRTPGAVGTGTVGRSAGQYRRGYMEGQDAWLG